MSPAEALAMPADQFNAFLLYMDRDLREQRKAARTRARKR